MPCLVGCLALGMPRVTLVLVWLLSDLIRNNFETRLWPILGLIFAPLTTLAYAYANSKCDGPPSGGWLALVVIAVLLDLGLLRGGRGKKKKDS